MKNGISLLLPSLNKISTIEACVRSFYEFADETIVVDNGSNDGTVDVLTNRPILTKVFLSSTGIERFASRATIWF